MCDRGSGLPLPSLMDGDRLADGGIGNAFLWRALVCVGGGSVEGAGMCG